MSKSKSNGELPFPLPLTSIERFHLLDDTTPYPNCVFGKFQLTGKLDGELAQRALTIAFERHPMVLSKIENRNGRKYWVHQTDFTPTIDWNASLEDARKTRPIDLDLKPGCNLYVGSDGTTTEVLFHIHHAVCDGIGGIHFITDWLCIYNNLVMDRPPSKGLRRLDQDILRDRNHLRLFSKRFLKLLWMQPIGLFGATKFIFRKINPLYPMFNNRDSGDYGGDPSILGTWLDDTTTQSLREKAISEGVPFNAMMLKEFFLFLQQWRTERLGHDGQEWIRVILPMSVRDISDRRMSAANRVAVIQLDRCHKDFKYPVGLLQGLKFEIGVISTWHLSKMFLLFIRGMSAMPGMLNRSAKSQKCRGTAVFTCLGEPISRLGLPKVDGKFRVGNMTLDTFDFVGPVRDGTPIYINFQKHMDGTRVSMRVDPLCLPLEEAQSFLSELKQQLVKSAAS